MDSMPEDEGPTVHLSTEHMKKLGVTNPKVGDTYKIQAHGHVVSHSQSDHGDGPNNHMSMALKKMAVAATQKAQEGTIEEGDLTGAKAAMDQALDKQEMSKGQLAKHRKTVGSKP
jgi:hypothetical protein